MDSASREEGSPAEGELPMIAIPVDPQYRPPAVAGESLYRAFEILMACFAFLAALPVMLLVAVIVRLDSPGPVLFVQQRMARSRTMFGRELAGRSDVRPPSGEFEPDQLYHVPETFPFVKFRTMYQDARERFPDLYDYNYMKQHHRGMYRLEKDPRVTRAGARLRELTLDELPNFWNVITGDMRLVGPRPEVPYVLEAYTPDMMRKFTVKPGITGLAQTNGRARLPLPEVVEWDLRYIRERNSAWYDIRILFRTVWLVLTRNGAF